MCSAINQIGNGIQERFIEDCTIYTVREPIFLEIGTSDKDHSDPLDVLFSNEDGKKLQVFNVVPETRSLQG